MVELRGLWKIYILHLDYMHACRMHFKSNIASILIRYIERGAFGHLVMTESRHLGSQISIGEMLFESKGLESSSSFTLGRCVALSRPI